jgi:hypothetical protein
MTNIIEGAPASIHILSPIEHGHRSCVAIEYLTNSWK